MVSKLRALLDKQKEGKNATQSQPIQPIQSGSQSSAQGGQVAEEKGKENDSAGRGISAPGGSSGSQQTSVLDAGLNEPPPGLTGIALIKWKKEHAANNVQKEETANGKASSEPNRPLAETNSQKEAGNILLGGEGKSGDKIAAQNSGPSAGQIAAIRATGDTAPIPGVPAAKIDTTELRNNLAYLANNIEQKELVGQIVRTIAVQLKQTPELTPYMSDADVDLVVRGLRRAYSIVARKKSEQREDKAKKGKNNSELMQAFKDAGLDGFDLGLKL